MQKRPGAFRLRGARWILEKLFEIAIQQTLHAAAVAGLILCHLMYGVVDGVKVQLLGLLGQIHLAGAGAALGVNTHLAMPTTCSVT